MIGIIDYGMGNLASVFNSLHKLGFEAEVFQLPDDASAFERLLLPGVGSFGQAMENLNRLGWTQVLRAYANTGRPILGICLGMQLLFTRGEEHGPTEGLDLLPGCVTLMTPDAPIRVPHVGWNNLIQARSHPLFDGIKTHVDFYFTHSYHCVPEDPQTVLARCNYGTEFVATVARDNVAGMQFHPEKSQPPGLRILENFARWDGSC